MANEGVAMEVSNGCSAPQEGRSSEGPAQEETDERHYCTSVSYLYN